MNDHHTDTVATMAGEKMYVESVFKEKNLRAKAVDLALVLLGMVCLWIGTA